MDVGCHGLHETYIFSSTKIRVEGYQVYQKARQAVLDGSRDGAPLVAQAARLREVRFSSVV